MKKIFIILFIMTFLFSCETEQEKERRTGHEWMHVVTEVHDIHNPDCKYCKERIHNEIVETVDSILKSRGL